MAVPGDGLARRKNLYEPGLVPPDWPSIRRTTGWKPPAELTEEHAKDAVRRLVAEHVLFCGRFCAACNADLSDKDVPLQSSTPTGIKAATGVYPEWTLGIPRGGHAPDCPVPYLLRWLGEPESVYTRLRVQDIDDEQAKLLTAGKESGQLIAARPENLSEAERAARVAVLKGFGYTDEQIATM